MKRLSASLQALAFGLVAPAALAEAPDLSGFAAVETRLFTGRPAFDGQETDPQVSLVLGPEFRYRTGDRAHQFSLVPHLRLDGTDDERTHADVREAYWRYSGDGWQMLAGANVVFWGVTESRHLVDVINQTDGVDDVDEEDKLGQPMLQLTLQRDWSELQVFLLPYFRERTFAGRDGRLRAPLPVDDGGAAYESGAEEWHPDIAIRYAFYVGEMDFGAHYFYGTGREPAFRVNETGTALIPAYELIHQVGADVQLTYGAWLWKFEGILREGRGDPFGAMVGGFEYTHYQLLDTAADLGLLMEYHLDGRDPQAPPTLFDKDIFLGSRLAINDIQDASLLVGAVVDSNTQSTSLFAEAERRFGDHWVVEIQGRFLTDVNANDPAAAFAHDDFINVSLQRHF